MAVLFEKTKVSVCIQECWQGRPECAKLGYIAIAWHHCSLLWQWIVLVVTQTWSCLLSRTCMHTDLHARANIHIHKYEHACMRESSYTHARSPQLICLYAAMGAWAATLGKHVESAAAASLAQLLTQTCGTGTIPMCASTTDKKEAMPNGHASLSELTAVGAPSGALRCGCANLAFWRQEQRAYPCFNTNVQIQSKRVLNLLIFMTHFIHIGGSVLPRSLHLQWSNRGIH